jgi:hypothetical protein
MNLDTYRLLEWGLLIVFAATLLSCGRLNVGGEMPARAVDAHLIVGGWEHAPVTGAGGTYDVTELTFGEGHTFCIRVTTVGAKDSALRPDGKILTYRYLGTYKTGSARLRTVDLTASLTQTFLTIFDASFLKRANRGSGFLGLTGWQAGVERELTRTLPADFFDQQDLQATLKQARVKLMGEKIYVMSSRLKEIDPYTRAPLAVAASASVSNASIPPSRRR